MRTTLSLDDDVAAAVKEVRRTQGIGLSEAVNHLVRRGMLASDPPSSYEHRPVDLGLKIDVANIADVLELLDGEID